MGAVGVERVGRQPARLAALLALGVLVGAGRMVCLAAQRALALLPPRYRPGGRLLGLGRLGTRR